MKTSTADSDVLINAVTIGEMRVALRSLDVKVPRLAGGRTGRMCEIYAVVRLLGTRQYSTDDFPVVLIKTERPDFLLRLGQFEVGIEHVEAVSENDAHEAKLRGQGRGERAHFVQPVAVTDPKKSRAQIEEEIDADEAGDGWCGESVERNWADAMAYFVEKKVAVANKTGFARFAGNWLLIYDNWSAPLLERSTAVSFLEDKLQLAPPWQSFEHVFILSDRVAIDLDKNRTVLDAYSWNNSSPSVSSLTTKAKRKATATRGHEPSHP